MNEKSDAQLLRHYAECGTEAAFREIVMRHTDFVYSAARRQVDSADLAADIAQGVFVDLARKAKSLCGRLTTEASLAGWLHRATRFASLNYLRDIRRQRTNEKQAMEQLFTNSEPSANWEQIRPMLDEALDSLGDEDREALLLRYFKNRDFRAVGLALGVSDDAAQKRVSRAVEKLREFFSKRNVTIGASGLTVLISANAVQSAPVGLAAAISAAAALAGTTTATSTVIAATKTLAMTALQKTIIGTVLAAAVGTGVYEAHQAAHLRDQVQTLQQQQAPLTKQVRRLSQERNDALKRLALLSAKPVPRLPAPPIHMITATNAPVQYSEPTNLYARFKNHAPHLTAVQVKAYLKDYRTNAASLLAAYRTSGDPALLTEAMEKYPNDPQVALMAIFDKNLPPGEQRQWLNAFEQDAPNNALANYLSALNYFNSGQIDQGIQELVAASGKQLDDYVLNSVQSDEEAYLSAGYSTAEAGRISTSWQELPQLREEKQLGRDLVELANAYSQAGDQTSAQAALQMAMNIGQNIAGESSSMALVSQLVGISIEKLALNAMNPKTSYGGNGQTVQDELNQITQNSAARRKMVSQALSLMSKMSDQDWVNYDNRRMVFGEVAADQWLVNKYGRQ